MSNGKPILLCSEPYIYLLRLFPFRPITLLVKESLVTIAVVAPQEPFEYYQLFWDGVWSAAHELAPLGVRVLTAATPIAEWSEQAKVLERAVAESGSRRVW